jgi:hypothetical protein
LVAVLFQYHCLNLLLGLFKTGSGLSAELFGLVADGLDSHLFLLQDKYTAIAIKT